MPKKWIWLVIGTTGYSVYSETVGDNSEQNEDQGLNTYYKWNWRI